jgi:glycosyltransferase involved in cell wall biosynthesis
MKVCIVSLNIVPYFRKIDGGPFGGAEVQTAILAEAFEAAGADVELVVSDLADDEELPFSAQNAYDSRMGIWGVRFFHPRLTGILDALARSDADVYFQHCAGMVTGLTAWFCKKHGKPFVFFAGSDSDFSFREVVISNPRDKLLYFWGLKNSSAIVAQNDHQAELCRTKFHKNPTVIPSAVALSSSDVENKDGSVVWVGSLRVIKRPALFLELARLLPDKQFVLIGGGIPSSPSHGREITDAATRIPNLTVTGHIDRNELEMYLAKASLLVNTSSFEGFPNAFLEAWTRHTPILSFVDVDGLIENERVGVVCRGLDDMVAQVVRLLDDDAARREMGARARRLIETRFAAPVLARRYLGLFDTLLTAFSGSSPDPDVS